MINITHTMEQTGKNIQCLFNLYSNEYVYIFELKKKKILYLIEKEKKVIIHVKIK